MVRNYSKSYCEVLEMLKYLPANEYNMIPKSKIEFYEKNKDKDYTFLPDSTKDLEQQNISREADAIMVSLYTDYLVTDTQKEKLICF